MTIREKVARGQDIRPRQLAAEINVSNSGIYAMIARGEIAARRLGEIVLIIPNDEARRVLGMKPESIAA